MTGQDESWGGGWDEPHEAPDSVFFNDDALGEATRRPDRRGPSVHDDYYDDLRDDYGRVAGSPPRRQAARVNAPTAAEWPGDYDERTFDRAGPNRVFIFALAAFFAVLLGVGFGIYSTLRGAGPDEAADTPADPAVSSDVSLEGAGGLDTQAGAQTDSDGALPLQQEDPAGAAMTASNGLLMSLDSDTFACDGQVRQFGLITGAEPGEEIAFTSPQSTGLSSGTADDQGSLPIRWNCDESQIGRVWELTATGVTSGRSATIVFTGVQPGADTTAAPAPSVQPLSVDVFENPFQCDGTVRAFATLSGVEPGAQVDFTSPQATGIRPGTGDDRGQVTMKWSCETSQAGTTWELTATEAATGRSVNFSFTGY